MNPCFIAIEGLDGSGGTTQVAMLCKALGAVATAEPSSGPVGQLIRQTLRNEVPLGDGVLPLLFAADRTDHLAREIEPLLAQGKIVVSDRYYASSLAYQSLVAPLGEVAELNASFRAPDITLFLDLSPEACIERITARGEQKERFEEIDRLREISAAYGAALALLSGRGERIIHIDASASVEDVHARIMEAIGPCLP